jgi:hypothetical protein
MKKQLAAEQQTELLGILKYRFEKNRNRHANLKWEKVEAKLLLDASKLWALNGMELSGGEPDVIDYDKNTDTYIFCDCSTESPKGRRSLCYDREALDARKEHKPNNSVADVANEMGIEILTEEQYRNLQKIGSFDNKTSSWVKTPEDIRELGGAIFCDFRYGKVFTYHNGAESYYAARGFRGLLKV